MIVITGPTACGKSAVGLFLADAVGGEILSADSMQIYKGLDIGTASPTREERARVPHHLVDIRYPWETYDAATFVRDALQAMHGIERRGRIAIVVGGTALYLKALLEGLFDGPSGDRELREALKVRMREEGPAAVHAELARVDPVAAGRIHPNDAKRIIRALEVHRTTGVPISELQSQWAGGEMRYDCTFIGLRRGRADLHGRINRRARRMVAAGLVMPSCGTGSLDPNTAERVHELTAQVSAEMRSRYVASDTAHDKAS